MAVLLSIRDLCVTYGNDGQSVYAVNNVSLDVQKKRSLGLIGESGSGKSTMMHAMLRVLNPRTSTVCGSVTLEGRELLSMDEAALSHVRWREMAVVFQKSMNALSPVHRVGAFMGDIYRVHTPKADKAEVARRVTELLEMVNLPPRVARMYPHELSGGMMQRVSIAMSLMFNPKLLILDEATTALDVVTQTQILKEIMALEAKLDMTRIMVTHDMSVVATTCDDVALLYAGNLVEHGPVDMVLTEPLHPYTRSLIESYPDLADDSGEELKSIKGSLPDLRELPAGCVFAPRCARAQERCFKEQPHMREYGENRKAACHLLGGGEE